MSAIKKCIQPTDDKHCIVEIDYKQLEVVILALLCDDSHLVSDLVNGVDMHCKSTSFLLNIPYDRVLAAYKRGDPLITDARKKAKALSFLVQFGGGYKTLAKNTGVTEDEAKRFISNYYKAYPMIQVWQQKVLHTVETNQHIVDNNVVVGDYISPLGTKFTFKKYPKPWDPNQMGFMPTEIKNYPIQGTAADIVKIGLTLLVSSVHHAFPNVKIGNTIHDSYICVVPLEDLSEFSVFAEHILTNVVMDVVKENFDIEFKAPLRVDIEAGPTWDDMEEVEVYWKKLYDEGKVS